MSEMVTCIFLCCSTVNFTAKMFLCILGIGHFLKYGYNLKSSCAGYDSMQYSCISFALLALCMGSIVVNNINLTISREAKLK